MQALPSSDLTPYQPMLPEVVGSINVGLRGAVSSPSRFQLFKAAVQHAGFYCWDLTRKYSYFAAVTTTLALDVIFMYGQDKEDVALSSISFTMLNFIGLLYLPYSCDDLFKQVGDLRVAVQTRARPVAAVSLLRVMDTSNNLGLTLIGVIAATANQLGNQQLMLSIFSNTIPWGEAAVGISLATRVAAMVMDRMTLKRLNREIGEEERILVAKTLLGNGQAELAAWIRASLDKDTRRTLIRKLHEFEGNPPAETFNIVKENIHIQIKVTQGGGIVVTLMGYGLLGLQRAFPYSKISAACNLSGLGLNVVWQGVEKSREIWNRRKINALT